MWFHEINSVSQIHKSHCFISTSIYLRIFIYGKLWKNQNKYKIQIVEISSSLWIKWAMKNEWKTNHEESIGKDLKLFTKGKRTIHFRIGIQNFSWMKMKHMNYIFNVFKCNIEHGVLWTFSYPFQKMCCLNHHAWE